jgi:diguanylate cyclase (GGDEF)-like protein
MRAGAVACLNERLRAADHTAVEASLTAEGRRARAMSGLTSRLILCYVEREGGRDAVDRLLAAVGMSDREDELRDEGSWFSFDDKIRLWSAAADTLGDPRVALHAGRAALDLGVADGLKRALRALGSPELVYRNVVRANAKFNWAHRLDGEQIGPQRMRLHYRDLCGIGYHPHDCEYTAGILSVVPQLFGLPAARVSHVVCGTKGADGCEFDITWTAGLHGPRRIAAGAGVAALGLAAAGLVPEAAVVAGGGALAAGMRSLGFLRGQVRVLRGRVQEQDEAIARLFASLGDLSADLRLDDVLDKITATAQVAAGGKEFALLLTDGTAMRADRDSGIPAPSLRMLEQWARDSRDGLAAGTVVVDDLSTLPELAALTRDPDVPLGSLCAAPLVFRDELLGVLVALAHGTTVFLPHDAAALGAYAAQAAIALSNARLVERLERQAAEDPLTGLANQRAFHVACGQELSRSARDGRPVAIVVLDLDHFKAINDAHGHPYGDEVLRRAGRALAEAVRPHDTVARMGGEEFALLLPDTDAEGAHAVAERARAAVAAVVVPGRGLTASAGVASHAGQLAMLERMLAHADRALYAAKAAGRDRTVVHDQAAVTDRPEPPLAALLDFGAIVPAFQPIVMLATGELIGWEALARFPDRADRSVADVFAEAHRLGLGARLEVAAIRAALSAPGRPEGAKLGLNLSLTTLSHDDAWLALPDDLSDVVIEITEHEFLGDDAALELAVARLRERGARIALDDAGAGYAGLHQLLRLRPDVVKLDRSLVTGVSADPNRSALICALVGFAGDVGMSVCAEGIEEAADLEALVALGVESGQGYLIARPAAGWPPPELTWPARGR